MFRTDFGASPPPAPLRFPSTSSSAYNVSRSSGWSCRSWIDPILGATCSRTLFRYDSYVDRLSCDFLSGSHRSLR